MSVKLKPTDHVADPFLRFILKRPPGPGDATAIGVEAMRLTAIGLRAMHDAMDPDSPIASVVVVGAAQELFSADELEAKQGRTARAKPKTIADVVMLDLRTAVDELRKQPPARWGSGFHATRDVPRQFLTGEAATAAGDMPEGAIVTVVAVFSPSLSRPEVTSWYMAETHPVVGGPLGPIIVSGTDEAGLRACFVVRGS